MSRVGAAVYSSPSIVAVKELEFTETLADSGSSGTFPANFWVLFTVWGVQLRKVSWRAEGWSDGAQLRALEVCIGSSHSVFLFLHNTYFFRSKNADSETENLVRCHPTTYSQKSK